MSASFWAFAAAVVSFIAWLFERRERKDVQVKAIILANETQQTQAENTRALQNLRLVVGKGVKAFTALNLVINDKEKGIGKKIHARKPK